MRTRFRWALLAIWFFLLTFQISTCQGQSLYVDKNYTGVETGTAAQPFHTVTAALNAASSIAHTVIYVRAGDYAGDYDEHLIITKPVSILNWTSNGLVRIGTAFQIGLLPPDDVPTRVFPIPGYDYPDKWVAHYVPVQGPFGGVDYVLRGNKVYPVQRISLRGWLRTPPDGPNYKDPDHHFVLEPDWDYLRRIGLDPRDILRVGNVSESNVDATNTLSLEYRCVSLPTITSETAGLRGDYQSLSHKGWRQYDDQPVLWPYDPYVILPEGAYIEIEGSLITDEPHGSEPLGGIGIEHGPTFQERQSHWVDVDDANGLSVARWTEIHPANTIRKIDPNLLPASERPHSATVRGIMALADNIFLSSTTTLETDIYPPGPDVFHLRLACEELPLEGTLSSTINDKQVLNLGDHIHVKIVVHSDGFGSSKGRFAALYRVYWTQ